MLTLIKSMAHCCQSLTVLDLLIILYNGQEPVWYMKIQDSVTSVISGILWGVGTYPLKKARAMADSHQCYNKSSQTWFKTSRFVVLQF